MILRNEGGFGLVMALGVLFGVGALGLGVAQLALTSESGASRAVDRAAAYYLAEGVVEKAAVELLAPAMDWSSLAGDTLYAAVSLDGGVCTLVATGATSATVDLTAQAKYRKVREEMRLRVKRVGTKLRWKRLDAPFTNSKEE
ncbi:MAG: hypothetical protein ACKVU1_01940 [bacterium]